jgi:hypothetical protein
MHLPDLVATQILLHDARLSLRRREREVAQLVDDGHKPIHRVLRPQKVIGEQF